MRTPPSSMHHDPQRQQGLAPRHNAAALLGALTRTVRQVLPGRLGRKPGRRPDAAGDETTMNSPCL